jgi:hypothetical protein
MTDRKPLTAEDVREIATQADIFHAEFCIEQDESQFGCAALKEARDELERLFEEAA